MGGILCVTLRTAVVPGQNIPRLKNLPTAGTVGRFGNVELKIFDKTKVGLASIPIKPLTPKYVDKTLIIPNKPLMLWLYGKHMDLAGIGGWNGSMEDVTSKLHLRLLI